MGGTGIRCLFDSKMKQRSSSSNRMKKKNCEKDKKIVEIQVCAKEETCETDSIDQQEDDHDGKCECQRNSVEIVACCKPGCSTRMPCIACTRSGCKAVIPYKILRKRECTCGKSKCEKKIKPRSKSEVRSRAKSGCRDVTECSDKKPRKKLCDKPQKACKKAESCDKIEITLQPSDICEMEVPTTMCCKPIMLESTKPKSPCRKLKSCPCDCCKNVTFNDKCEVIPDSFSSDQDYSSGCDDEIKISFKPETTLNKQKQPICKPKNPCGRSDCKNSFCMPEKFAKEMNCQCNNCKPQSSNRGRSRKKSGSCEIQIMNEMSSMMPPTYVMQGNNNMGNASWPREMSCPCHPCEIPNYGNSLYQNSYPSPPTFNRQF